MFFNKYLLLICSFFLGAGTTFGQWSLPTSIVAEVDAVAASPTEGSIVFFSANAIQQYSLVESEDEPAFNISSIENLPSTIESIDAATSWDDEHLLLFVDQNYFMYNLKRNDITETNVWNGLPAEWKGKLDAVCYWEENHYMFFFSNEYVLYDVANKSYSEVGVINNWEGWPESWTNGFGDVVNIGSGIFYFFRGAEYLSFDIETMKFDGPYPADK